MREVPRFTRSSPLGVASINPMRSSLGFVPTPIYASQRPEASTIAPSWLMMLAKQRRNRRKSNINKSALAEGPRIHRLAHGALAFSQTAVGSAPFHRSSLGGLGGR